MACCAFASETLPVQSVYSIGTAGDHLENQAGNNYSPKNMVDGNVKTAWALPYHSGEVILQFSLKKQAKVLEHLIIHNGYEKSEKRFFQNLILERKKYKVFRYRPYIRFTFPLKRMYFQ